MSRRTCALLASLTLLLPLGACASTPPGDGDGQADAQRPSTATSTPVAGVSPDDEAVERTIKAELPDLRVWVPLDEAAMKARVTPALKPGEKLVSEALIGPIGPTDDAVLALVEVDGGPSRLGGFLLTPGADGGDARHDLPEFDPSQLYQVEWVALVNGDEDADWEIVVRSSHLTGVGPEGAVPYPTVAVIDWDGQETHRLAAAEKLLEGVVGPKEARVRLERERFDAGRRAGHFAGPCRMVTGDLVTTYSYDPYGRLVREVTGEEERAHRYDDGGKIVATVTSYPDSPPVRTRYTCDARGLVVASREVVAGEGGAPRLFATVNVYDGRGRLVREASIDSSGAQHISYRWKGQRLMGSDHDYPDSDEFCAPTPPTTYEEDPHGRRIREELRDTPELCESPRDETWRYDDAGNLIEHRVHTLEGDPDVVTTYDYGCWTTTPSP